MNNIKLTIFTGVQDTDIVDVGLYNPAIVGVLNVAYTATFSTINGMLAEELSPRLQVALDDLNTNPDKYAIFSTANLLAAEDYLGKLKIACDTFPLCKVVVESL